jgi:hypothetical protein
MIYSKNTQGKKRRFFALNSRKRQQRAESMDESRKT